MHPKRPASQSWQVKERQRSRILTVQVWPGRSVHKGAAEKGGQLLRWPVGHREPRSDCSHTLYVRLVWELCLSAGHDKPVNSVSWSLNRQDWLSASEDQSLRIWSRGSPKPAIIMVNVLCMHSLTHSLTPPLIDFLLLVWIFFQSPHTKLMLTSHHDYIP